MLDYLITSLTAIEGLYAGSGILLTGDFKRLNISRLLRQFKLKQLVREPTRGDQVLDLIITNMSQVYDRDTVEQYPPFGLSDHNVVVLHPKAKSPRTSSRRIVTRRDTRPSRKLELGRYLCSIDWSILDSVISCEDKLQLFLKFINVGLDTIMPLKTVRFHSNDAPWITADFKHLINLRQKAFAKGDAERYRYYRNIVNRERKSCRRKFYASKVANLKEIKPSQWWKVKKIAGMAPACGNDDLRSHLHIDGIENRSMKDIANEINEALLEPMLAYKPLETLPPYEADSEVLVLTEIEVCLSLQKLNSRKASGPDGVSNWLLKDYAEILAYPVCSILNSSFAEQELPPSWKHADVTSLPKEKPVTIINKHLRPISLTPVISKVAEDFVVVNHVGPAVLEIIDPNQFGAIPKSSTVQALISMIHTWSKATDATGAAVRVVLFDYRKAFDLIDHHILIDRVYGLRIPRGVARWVSDFLKDRKQRIKLSMECRSEWGHAPSGVPQGTKLGPWLFLLMINDLSPSDVCIWKYVDDTTIAEVVPKGSCSQVQSAVASVESWSTEQKLQLNEDKCKELIIDFKREKHAFDPLVVNDKELSLTEHAKILGVTVSNNLTWNEHINGTIKKANKRLYFLVLLKRAKVPLADIISFYCTCVRPVLEYCSQVFHHSIPVYLSDDLEFVQKRAFSIISPGISYSCNLDLFNLNTLKETPRSMHQAIQLYCI